LASPLETPSLSAAWEQMQAARAVHAAACDLVWRAIQREHPEFAKQIRELGCDDAQAAMWLCTPQRRWDDSPAALIVAGRVDEVARVIDQALAGIF
jgi:hypothetical protein